MKKIFFTIIALVVFVSCENNKANSFEEDKDGNLMSVEQLNDSIIKRTVLDPNERLSSIEYENIKGKTVTVHYYDENGKRYETWKCKTDSTGIVENYIYSPDGKVTEKILKSWNNIKIGKYKYNDAGKIVKKYFYREGNDEINAIISYNDKGLPELTGTKSHFLKLTKNNNILILKPIGLEPKQFIHAEILILDNFDEQYIDVSSIYGFKENPKNYPFIIDLLSQGTDSLVRMDLNKLKSKKDLKCKVFINDEITDGTPNFITYELYIEDLNSIPKNNLYPIVK